MEYGNAQLAAWESFYVIVGSSGAALIGLQFVVMTLMAEFRRSRSTAPISAFGSPTVVHFAGALLISALMSAPWHSFKALSIVLGVLGLAGATYEGIVIDRGRRQKEYEPVGEDWVFYFIIPGAAYVTLAIAAFLLKRHTTGSLFAVAATALTLLLAGIRNAWDTVLYIVTTPTQASTSDSGSTTPGSTN